MTSQVLLLAVAAVVYTIIKLLNATDIPKIKNLPEIPGVPIFGNLWQLGTDHARVTARWAKKYGPVFQTRLGNRRVVFVNSYATAKHFWITHQSALISRPTFHTFHSVVSSSQGFTIATSPWDESCKRRRKAAATALNKPAVATYMPIMDLESMSSIKEMLRDSQQPENKGEINPGPYFQRFALNTSLTLNYGIRISGNINDELLKEILLVERRVSTFRSTSNNWQDYVPLLRLFSRQNNDAQQWRARRDAYLSQLLATLKKNIADGTDKPCITGNILKDPEAKLNEAEIKSICLTMVAAGIDTVPGNLIMGMAYFSTPHGQEIQKKALECINDVYPDGDAWEKCLHEEKVPFITALVKEIIRFWMIFPISLPRVSIRDVPYEDAVIPAGTMFLVNCWAASYDEERYKNPQEFNVDRFLGDNDISAGGGGTPHFGFGAGSRMCIGSHLGQRMLYTAFLRMITAFAFLPAENPADWPIIDPIECNETPTSLTTEPKPFKIRLKVRDQALADKWFAEAEERTKDL